MLDKPERKSAFSDRMPLLSRFIQISEMFYVYILKSEKFGTYYIGESVNLQRRIILHNQGKVRSTKFKRPWRLYWSKSVSNLSEARKLETELKSIKKRKILEEVIKHF